MTRIKTFSKGRNRLIEITYENFYSVNFSINIYKVIKFELLIVTDQKISDINLLYWFAEIRHNFQIINKSEGMLQLSG